MTENSSNPTSPVLAIDGGSPAQTAAFAPWPVYAPDEVDAVTEILRTGRVNYWTGDVGRKFEREFADYCGARFAVALSNGTVAVELALRALGIGPGDEVIVPPKTFIATASAVVMCGAVPVFADVDPCSQCLDAAAVAASVTEKTRAVIVVHLAGWVCDMDALRVVAQRHGLAVVEDCAQAHGATYRGRKVGSLGDIAAFSFCQDKIMSTGGEGGMLVTSDEALWRAAWSLKDHGKNYAAVYEREVDPHAVYLWLHESFGTNARMTEMQSAIGRAQLSKLDDWVALRRRNAGILEQRLRQLTGLEVPPVPEHIGHARYKFYAFVRPDHLLPDWGRDRLIHAISAEGIPCFSGSCSEIYQEKAFVDSGLAPDAPLPVAHRLSRTSLMFPVHPTLSEADMHSIADGIAKVMAAACPQ